VCLHTFHPTHVVCTTQTPSHKTAPPPPTAAAKA
jgi:hypothetical protein